MKGENVSEISATLQDVARAAGVHVSTASRVLHHPEDRAASSQTAQRIREAAQTLGYVRNQAGARLRRGTTGDVAVLVPRITDFVLAAIYEGIEEQANQLSYTSYMSSTLDDDETRRLRVKAALQRSVDGLLFGDADLRLPFWDELRTEHVPFVLVNRSHHDHPSVTCDDYAGGRLAAEHLLAAGHTRMAVVAGWHYASTGRDRLAAFTAACLERNVQIPPEMIDVTGFDASVGRAATHRFLNLRNPPTAIFAVNDFAAIGVMGALRDRGLRAGANIAVVGYNDTPLAGALPIPLTSVRSPMREQGALAMRVLADLIDGKSVESVRLAPTLIARESSMS